MKRIKLFEDIVNWNDWEEIQEEPTIKIGDKVRTKNNNVFYWFDNKEEYRKYTIERIVINIKKPNGEFNNETEYVVALSGCSDDVWFRIEDLEKI